MHKRIDRFVETALRQFAGWITASQWQGKERDCINLFAMRFLMASIEPNAAIFDPAQIRIEGGVPQPSGFQRPSATKDLVIWRDPLAVAWDEEWRPVNSPCVVMEWKTRRHGRHDDLFDRHDTEWLTAFSAENLNSFGYAVTVDFCRSSRLVSCCRFRRGAVTRCKLLPI